MNRAATNNITNATTMLYVNLRLNSNPGTRFAKNTIDSRIDGQLIINCLRSKSREKDTDTSNPRFDDCGNSIL
jgi:hypothetical protein